MAYICHSQPIDFNLGISILQAIYSQGVIYENFTNIHPDVINMVNNYYYYSYYYSTMVNNLNGIQDISITSEPTLEEAIYNFEQLIGNGNTSSHYLDESWINELEELLNKDFN